MDDHREARERYRSARFFPALDGLRAVSIVAVIWHHAGGEQAHGLLAQGFRGVSLFFAISGFLITTLLLREQEAHGAISLARFYLRRALRIFPLYYLVLALYAALVLAIDRHSDAGRGFFANLPWFLTYSSNWFVARDAGTRVIFYFAWSLATEEQFYLVWPGIVRIARTWWVPPLAMAGLLAAHLLGDWAASRGWLDARALPMRMLLSIATSIGLGCLAAYLLHRPSGFHAAWLVAGQVWSAPLAAAAVAATLVFAEVPSLAIHLAMTWLVVAVCIRPDHLLRLALANPVMRHVGTVSYGMYLMHMLAMNAVTRAVPGAGNALRFALATGGAVGLASASYSLLERRLLSLKDRLGGSRRPPAEAAQLAAEGVAVAPAGAGRSV